MSALLHIENPMFSDLMAHLRRDEAREQAHERAHAVLHAELIDALLNDPVREVSTPGWPAAVSKAQDVVFDELAGMRGDEFLCRLLCVVGLAAQGKFNGLHVMAGSLIAEVADRHAAFHADDMAAAMLEPDQ